MAIQSARVYLGLGTNLGDKWANLRAAVETLRQYITIDQISPVYETAAWGKTDQPAFLNLCLSGQTKLGPEELLAAVKEIERELGRKLGERWGPRLIDVDILFYDDVVMTSEQLTLPHPGVAQRAFVLAPLAEIAPELVHPVLGCTVKEMLAAVGPAGVRRLDEWL